MTELAKAYTPVDAEAAVTAKWDAARAGHAEPVGAGVETYSVVIPPPNVTAPLHLGHALNNTLQDVLVRFHRMQGLPTLWMPGTDHAGIATQTVVEKRLLSQGTKRLDMGREAFIDKTQEWKDEYEAIILSQLKALGASCDWDRTRFTMDDMCATAVRHAFFTMFEDGLIYRGKRLVNWDPATRTALADDEVEMQEVDGHMWYLRYPLTDGSGHVTVATTRPETMLGDTAIALNPDDPRAESLRGKSVELPIVGRIIPIVEDDYVVMADPEGDTKAQYASGFLKVTPAHDPNDWDIGVRHELPVINIMGPDGSISADYGWNDVSDTARQFVGLSREDARIAIVDWFKANDLLDEIRDYSHSVGHSYRSHVPIEPWLSDQWYVAVTDERLRGSALRAQAEDQASELPADIAERTGDPGDGELRFYPPRYARTFSSWHENLRDWCISRQLWWGHQIPVWMRLVDEADAPGEVVSALQGVGIDEPVQVTSTWTAKGAAHHARRVTATEVEESICIPPDAAIRRSDAVDASSEADLVAAAEAAGYTRDPDVLDTWFSSALWPLSTMGWPYPEDFPETVGLLESYNPTSMLSTAREIITLWVSRMVMFNRYFLDGAVPFKHVFIHAMIQDGHGQKMSKSLGNGVDPRDIIHSHGADAMRFTLVQMTTDTQDVRMPVDMVCPHTGEPFTPEFIVTSAGHTVTAPLQTCPSDPTKTMITAYGMAVPTAEVNAALEADTPLAGNTSSKFDQGRNFANKVWNATRFALGRLDGTTAGTTGLVVDPATARFADRWILARLAETVESIDQSMANYQFNQVADTLYDFIWRDVSDRYLEAVKATIDDDPAQQVVLGAVLDAALRLLHPVCPFVTETLWPFVSEVRGGDIVGVALAPSELLAVAAWPEVDPGLSDPAIVAAFDRADALAAAIRAVRSEQQVKPRKQITVTAPAAIGVLFAEAGGVIESLAGIATVVESDEAPAGASPIVFEGHQLFLSDMTEAGDAGVERSRLAKRAEELAGQIAGLTGRLSNAGYVDNAPPNLVQETRDQLAAAQADLAATEAALAQLDTTT